MTITIEAWVIPALLSVLWLGGWVIWSSAQPQSSGYGAIGAGLVDLIALLAAVILTLATWLIWAIVK
jgi:hypothetical protein